MHGRQTRLAVAKVTNGQAIDGGRQGGCHSAHRRRHHCSRQRREAPRVQLDRLPLERTQDHRFTSSSGVYKISSNNCTRPLAGVAQRCDQQRSAIHHDCRAAGAHGGLARETQLQVGGAWEREFAQQDRRVMRPAACAKQQCTMPRDAQAKHAARPSRPSIRPSNAPAGSRLQQSPGAAAGRSRWRLRPRRHAARCSSESAAPPCSTSASWSGATAAAPAVAGLQGGQAVNGGRRTCSAAESDPCRCP